MLSNSDDAVEESWTTEKKTYNLQKFRIYVIEPSGKSLVFARKRKGPWIEPCRTPALKLTSTIFYQKFISSPNFHSQDIQIFVIFFLPFHTSQIHEDKWGQMELE